MKSFARFLSLVVTLLCITLVMPVGLSAQSDEAIQTVTVGGTVEVDRNRVEFMLDAQEGQTVSLLWDGRFVIDRNCDAPYPETIYPQTEITNADGGQVQQIGLLYRRTDTSQAYTTEVYRLEGTPPYHVSARICSALSVSVSVIEGDTIPRIEQPALSIGQSVTVPALPVGVDNILVFPLNVQAGDVFTLEAKFINTARADEYPMYRAIVRDANGHLVPSDFSAQLPLALELIAPVYTVDGPLPYRLEFIALGPLITEYPITDGQLTGDISYSVELVPGNTKIVDRGLLTPGTRIEGNFEQGKAVIVTLDVAEDQTFTYRRGGSQGTPASYFFNADDEVADVVDNFTNNPTEVNWVMHLVGPPPYVHYLEGQGSYSLLIETGDTIPSNEVGRLAPGERLQVTVPAANSIIDFVALDVNPESTVTVNWGIPQTEFSVKDSAGNFMFTSNDDWNDGFAVVDLTQGTPPFMLSLDDARYYGQTFTFTLSEGETPLAPDAATASNTSANTQPAVESSTTGSETNTGASCTVSVGGTVNQRSGPGTNFAVSGTLAAGSSANVDGQTTGADGFTWYRLSSGVWVRGDLVITTGDCSAVPQVTS